MLLLLVCVLAGPQCVTSERASEAVAKTQQTDSDVPASSPAPASAPATTPPATPPAEPPARIDPFAYYINDVNALPDGFLVIESADDTGNRAWIEGSVIGDDRIVIQTNNVLQFRLDIGEVRINWDKRIVLRIDGYNSELTRKRWPRFSLIRTSTGAWTAVD